MEVPGCCHLYSTLSPSSLPNSLSSYRPSAIPELHPAAGEFHAYYFPVLCARGCLQVGWAPSCSSKESPLGAMSPSSLDAQILALQGGNFPTSSGSPFPGSQGALVQKAEEEKGDWQSGLAEVPSLPL